MSTSLRRPLKEPFSLFSFQDIIFAVTGVLLFVAIWFSISARTVRFSAGQDRNPGDAKRELDLLAAQIVDREARDAVLQTWIAAGRPKPDDMAIAPPGPPPSPSLLIAASHSETSAEVLESRLAVEEAAAADRLRAMQDLENRWIATRRIILEYEHQSDSILLIRKTDNSLLEPILVLVSTDWLDLEYAGRADRRRRLSGPVDRDTVRRALREFDPTRHFLWFGIRPSGVALFDTVRDEARAAGFTAIYEPISETQSVNFHSRERALEFLP